MACCEGESCMQETRRWKHLHLYLDAVHFVTRLLVLIHLSVKVRHKITTCDDSLSISFSKSSIRAVISSIVGWGSLYAAIESIRIFFPRIVFDMSSNRSCYRVTTRGGNRTICLISPCVYANHHPYHRNLRVLRSRWCPCSSEARSMDSATSQSPKRAYHSYG